MIYIRYEIINDFFFLSATMNFRSKKFHSNFSFFITFVPQKMFIAVLVVVSPIVVVNKVSTSMQLFWITHINRTNHVYTVFKFFNFGLNS